MIRILIGLIICVIFTTGCTPSFEKTRLNTTVRGADSIQELCLNGVTYYFYHRGYKGSLAPKFDKNSKVVLCDLYSGGN